MSTTPRYQVTETLGRARTARIAKNMLKKAFPGQTFSVTSNPNEMNVNWTGGPSIEQVKNIVGIFEGSFYDSDLEMNVGVTIWESPDGTYSAGNCITPPFAPNYVPPFSNPKPHPHAVEVRSGVYDIFYYSHRPVQGLTPEKG